MLKVFHNIQLLSLLIILFSCQQLQAQELRKTYEIAEVKITGTNYLDEDILKTVAGLTPGQKIEVPTDPAITKAMQNLWKEGLLEDISIEASEIRDNRIFINIKVVERPRLSGFEIAGVNKTQQAEIKEKLNKSLIRSRMVTLALKKDVDEEVKKYYADKGYTNVVTKIEEQKDTLGGGFAAKLMIHIDRGNKVHVNQINFVNNNNAADSRLKRTMKGTKEMPRLSLYPANRTSIYPNDPISFSEYINNKGVLSPTKTLEYLDPYFRWNIFGNSKFSDKKYKEDQLSVVNYYNSIGFRDAQIEEDTLYFVENKNLNIDIKIKEGQKYYFGDLEWKGNTKYSDSILNEVLGIKRGDVYNRELLEGKLGIGGSPEGGMDIGSLYLDDGYLFFQVTPIEKSIIKDTINFELILREGPQATIKNIIITGNDRTSEDVFRREIRTYPGNKFSRSDLMVSLRLLHNLGFVDPEKTVPNPKPNMSDGTVDIEYHIAEKSSDQLEVSAGFGGGIGFTGTIGIVFNNFSTKKLFRLREWDPLPIGDGQKLSLRYQSNGLWYNSLNFGFTEPWLGGKRPTALNLSAVYGRYSIGSSRNSIGYYLGDPNETYIRNWGGGIGLSKRLTWPDNNFVFSASMNYQNYFLKNYSIFSGVDFDNGTSNNLFLKLTLARTTVDQPIFPRSGSNINLSLQFTPPFSAFSEKDYLTIGANEKYKWIEYHKYRFNVEWYQKIAGNLILKLAAKHGYLGYYNKDVGFSPFERFQVGGDGLSGFNYFVGKDIISQRGYDEYAMEATIFNKYTAEVRYPFSLNPSATIYGLAFFEAANGWNDFKSFNPFNLYRSAGLGVRIHLPMFGLLGLDYGLGIDRLDSNTKFGGAAKFTFMLGFEPE